jgi:putative hemolysin
MMVEILFLLVLILINAFFAASEVAMISLNDNKIKVMADEGNKSARMLKDLLSEPSRFLATIQVGITMAGFLASAFAAESFANDFVRFLRGLGLDQNSFSDDTLRTFSLIFITLILSYVTLVLGELVPKRIAMKYPEGLSMVAVRPITWIAVIASPFVKLLTLSTDFIVRIFGVNPGKHEETVTEEEIRLMVDVGVERETIDENEKEMINNIFDLDNKNVEDIMTHRTEIIALSVDAPLREVVDLINHEKYTRIPIYEEAIDNIIGIINSKDLFQFIHSPEQFEQFHLRQILREPYFVPSSKKIRMLIKEMQKSKMHLAVVIDEYGGTAGLVTIEDLLEEIVGNIFDEHDELEEAAEEFVQLDEYTYIIDGSVNLEEVKKRLSIDFPVEDYDTLGGFVIGLLGKIPNRDEHHVVTWTKPSNQEEEEDEEAFKSDSYTLEIVELVGKRVSRVKLRLPQQDTSKSQELNVGD